MFEVTIKASASEIDRVQARLLAALPELEGKPVESGVGMMGAVRRTFQSKGDKTGGEK